MYLTLVSTEHKTILTSQQLPFNFETSHQYWTNVCEIQQYAMKKSAMLEENQWGIFKNSPLMQL